MPTLIKLGTLTAPGPGGGPVTSVSISDSSPEGRTVLTGNAAAGRGALGAAAASDLAALGSRVTALDEASTGAVAVLGVRVTELEAASGPTSWANIGSKPPVIAAGATPQAARDAIGAGTSSLTLGLTAPQAKPGNWTPTAADISDAQTPGRNLLKATDQAAARATIGAAAQTDVTALGVTVDELSDTVAGLGSGGTSEVLVWRYTAGAWPALPATAPAGIKIINAYGPSQPGSVPSWVGPGAGKIPALYFYAPLA